MGSTLDTEKKTHVRPGSFINIESTNFLCPQGNVPNLSQAQSFPKQHTFSTLSCGLASPFSMARISSLIEINALQKRSNSACMCMKNQMWADASWSWYTYTKKPYYIQTTVYKFSVLQNSLTWTANCELKHPRHGRMYSESRTIPCSHSLLARSWGCLTLATTWSGHGNHNPSAALQHPLPQFLPIPTRPRIANSTI
jgi:hypothetical protein